MKRVCFGTLYELIYQARTNSRSTNEAIIADIFKAYCLEREDFGFNCSHLKNGHDNVPLDLMEQAKTLPPDTVDANFRKYVIPHIKPSKTEALVRAIKAIISDDKTITDDTVLGYETGYEKEKILSNNVFCLSSLLASLFRYSIVIVDNPLHENFNEEIDKNFVDSFNDPTLERIYFEDSNPSISNNLSFTINDEHFNCVFKKIEDLKINNNFMPSCVEIFTAEISNKRFRFSDTKEFISKIISNYVMSRARINSATNTQEFMTIGVKALSSYMKRFKLSENTILGETLLYAFLECALKAPKIMTKIELDNSSKSNSDGIYLLRTNYKGYPITQLVFGASNIISNLKDAVDLVFDKIESIKQNDEDEFYIVNDTLCAKNFDKDTIQYLNDILKPKKEASSKPEMAFGCFLGYTFKLDDEITYDKPYSEYVTDKLKQDISDIKAYIEEAIGKRGFDGYNFYFYIVPFNNADIEKINLIKEL